MNIYFVSRIDPKSGGYGESIDAVVIAEDECDAVGEALCGGTWSYGGCEDASETLQAKLIGTALPGAEEGVVTVSEAGD